MRSLWHRFLHNVQHLGRQQQRYEPNSLAARQAQSKRLRGQTMVAADPIESFPEPDPMRPSLDLSEAEVYSDDEPERRLTWSEYDADVQFRVGRLEGLLQEHRLHERSCPVRRAQVTNAMGAFYVEPGECDCWLSTGNVRGRR